MGASDLQSLVFAAPAPIARKSSFYLAMRILPYQRRQAMYNIYAFCRAVDDIADDKGSRSRRRAMLDRWRMDFARLYSGQGSTELTKGLAPAVQAFDLRQDDFLSILDGMEMDVHGDIRAPDWNTLDLYCDRVASAVGRLSVKVFGIEESKGRPLSHHLGRALQLTNILRDLDQDAKMGRLYLPREALTEAGIAEDDIGKVLAHPRLEKACMAVVKRARHHFRDAEAVMAGCSRRSVRSPRIMAYAYRALLDGLVARGWTEPRREVRPAKRLLLSAVLRYGFL